MKKILILSSLYLLFCSSSFAQSFYFNDCKISNAVIANYTINTEKKIIEVTLKAIDGAVQNFSDKIKSIEKDKIISEKIKSTKGKDLYYQYFLNSKSKSVIKLEYKKESGIDMEIFKLNQKTTSSCSDVKAGWDNKKIEKAEVNKEKKQIFKEQEKLKKEQSELAKCQGKDHKKWNNCKGSFTSETGRKYNGLFIVGKIIKGTSVYPGGSKYAGEFKNFQPHGYGTFLWANGDKYYGQWKDGKSNGNGTKIWKNGRKYLGTFKNDELHGQGTLFYPDGKQYEGEFLNGKRHGKGTFIYSDGTAYIGNFINGKEDGVGECINENGISVSCIKKAETQAKNLSGKDTQKISIIAKKWVRISQYESNTKKGKKIMDKLKEDFEIKASEICSSKGGYNVLTKSIEVLEIDETPTYGMETKLKIGINGIVECKKV